MIFAPYKTRRNSDDDDMIIDKEEREQKSMKINRSTIETSSNSFERSRILFIPAWSRGRKGSKFRVKGQRADDFSPIILD